MERKIVIGYDATNRGRDALNLGKFLAGVLGARPIVARVLPWPSYLLPPADMQELVDAEVREGFALARDELDGLEPETVGMASDSPAAALSNLAAEESAALIAVGSCHRGPLGRTLLGSVGQSLLHGAPCAVAVAPRDYHRPSGESSSLRIAVAFDGSPESWVALETAVDITLHASGELSIITVADYPHYGYATTWSVLTAGEVHDAEYAQKQRVMELALSKAREKVRAEGRLLTGDAGKFLAQVSGDFDLLIAGSRAYGPLRRTLLGSATRRLLSDSGCPTLILPRGVESDPLGLDAEARADALA